MPLATQIGDAAAVWSGRSPSSAPKSVKNVRERSTIVYDLSSVRLRTHLRTFIMAKQTFASCMDLEDLELDRAWKLEV